MTDSGHGYKTRPRVWYRSTWFAALVVVGFLVVLGVILVIPVWATSTPKYCMSCKATKKAGLAWEVSTHRSVACTKCHIAPGLKNQVSWRMREWLNVWADYLNVPEVPNRGQMPTNANCLQCHSLNKIPSSNGVVRMPHELHVQLRNLTCADCHDQVSHRQPGVTPGVSMSVCSMCHNSEGAAYDCMLCHVTPPPKNVHPPAYIKTHGKQALAEGEAACLRCHHSATDFCDPCHSRPPADHFSGTWRYTHGPTAKQDRLACYGCHDQKTFCDQCHQVNHPVDWVQTHGPIAARSVAACLVCHPAPMCTQCHQSRGVKVVLP